MVDTSDEQIVLPHCDEPTFTCAICRCAHALEASFPLGHCACLACRPCLVRTVEVAVAGAAVTAETDATVLPLRCLRCPLCGMPGGISRADALHLAGDAIRAAEAAAAEVALVDLPRCPSCGVAVEMVATEDAALPEGLRPTGIPEFDRTLPRRLAQTDRKGRPLSRAALLHREAHRFRCTCGSDFCGACRCTPYHLGYTCQAWSEFLARPDCMLLCGEKATSPEALIARAAAAAGPGFSVVSADGGSSDAGAFTARLADAVARLPLKALLEELAEFGLRAATEGCIERREVEALACKVHVCAAPACRGRLAATCLRALPCGHLCAGCHGEAECPPCFACSGRGACSGSTGQGGNGLVSGQPQAEGPSLCPCCAEPLPPGPAVRLECGHALHSACLARRLAAGADRADPAAVGSEAAPPLSFDFRRCPLCRARIGDLPWPADVARPLRKATELEAAVTARAVKRLKADQRHRRDDAIRPGGAFDGRPREYALTLYRYYQCEVCRKPYFGGERRCEGADMGDLQGGAIDLEITARRLCGGCAALEAGKSCPLGHDQSFIEWKCRFCCSVAVWFCWGTTHLCDRCHDDRHRSAKPCLGPSGCPLGAKHPPNGSIEPACLGCSLCRHRDA